MCRRLFSVGASCLEFAHFRFETQEVGHGVGFRGGILLYDHGSELHGTGLVAKMSSAG